jgi:hypothetical protein
MMGKNIRGVAREPLQAKEGDKVIGCDYTATHIDRAFISLDIYPSTTAAQQNIDGEVNCSAPGSPLDGLGEQACEQSWQDATTVIVLERNVIFTVGATDAHDNDNNTLEVSLARIALKHL